MMGGIENIAKNEIEQIKSIVWEELKRIKEIPIRREDEGECIIDKPDIAFMERATRMALIEQNADSSIENNRENSESISESDIDKPERLTDEEKVKIKEETGWSDEIIECIQNMDQYEVLRNAGLKEAEVNGQKCLVKENIDLDYTDADGISNRDRIDRGLAPLDSETGKPIELHHLGQKADSPLVELTEQEHRTGEYKDGKKNQSLWHDNTIETEVHGEGNNWDKERQDYWQERSKQIEGGNS